MSNQIQQAIQSTDERYRNLVESSPNGILSIDTKGKITSVNPKMLEILGSPSAKATMKINMFNFKALQVSGVSDAFKSVIESGNPFQTEIEYTSKWSKTAYLKYQIVPTYGEDERINGAQAIVEDITDQKQAEDALRRSEVNFKNIFNLASDAIFIKDKNLMIIDANRSAEKLFGYSHEELLARPEQTLGDRNKNDYTLTDKYIKKAWRVFLNDLNGGDSKRMTLHSRKKYLLPKPFIMVKMCFFLQ